VILKRNQVKYIVIKITEMKAVKNQTNTTLKAVVSNRQYKIRRIFELKK
jgi:hypothetical protein